MPSIIILLIILYLLYRAWRPQNLSRWKLNLDNQRQGNPFDAFRKNKTSKSQGRVIDEMKPCVQCGTYNSTQMALLEKGLYFCNSECHKNYLNAH